MKSCALLPLLAAALSLPLFAQSPNNPSSQTRSHGVVLSDIDHSVKPGDNFYLYANGNWMQRTQIPADRVSVSAFSLLDNEARARVAALVEDVAKSNPAPDTDPRRIADLYKSYMDEAAIEKAGISPLKPELDAIAAIKNQHDLAHQLGLSLRADVDALNNTNFHTANLFGLWVAPGFNDSDHYAPYFMQGGLTLPSRDYYITDSARMKSIREAFTRHAANLFRLAGYDNPEQRAQHVVALETAIARAHISLAENEDIKKANNTWTWAEFTTKAPGLDWKEFFRSAGLERQASFIVWQPTAVTGEAALVALTPIDAWKDFLTLHLLEQYGGVLPKSFADERFSFFGPTLTGATAQRPREQRAILTVNANLGEAVGKLYAQRFFSPEEKAQIESMVANLMTAFRKRLEANTWMAPATKQEAITKLGTLQVGIGYPDKWRNYNGLDIRPNDILGNLQRSSLYDYRYELSRIGKPVDRKEWCMTPQTVNAVNLPLNNGLNFPAAILNPPFYDPHASAAFNYGAIGSVIGHEISHTFDSEGAAFDSKGRVRDWWTPADFKHFEADTAALARQYDTYAPFPDLHVNGKQTLGENIADVAGLAAAYDAFHASLNGQPAPIVDGLTGDQQFFLAYAQTRNVKTREAALRQQVLTDPHAPGEFRAETVRNLDAWYPAFEVKPGEKLYLPPDQRIHIW